MIFQIKHDTDRYGETKGSIQFGKNITIEGTQEQAENLAYILSGYYDAGLDHQFYIVGIDDL